MMKRTLNIALMLVAAVLFAGCPKQITPETTPEEETIVVTPEGVQIPFEVMASTSADDATKVTVDYGGTHLFQAGDILRITGEHISGDLTMQGDAGYDYATFKGVLTWTGEGMPAADLPLTAKLISEFNRMPAEGDPYANAIADLLDQAVQQFSNISGTGTYGGKTFALKQSSAFIQFEINMAGLSENGKVKVRIQNKSVTEILASCDTVTIKGGKAIFTAAFAAGTVLDHASVYVDGLIVPFAGGGATLAANTQYHVSKTVNLLETPLTWQARYESGTVEMNYYKSSSLSYSINGGVRVALGSTTRIPLAAGDVIHFFDDYEYEHGNIWSDDAGSNVNGFYVYGNVMSLISSTEYPKIKVLTQEKVFSELFHAIHGTVNHCYYAIKNHPTRDILLPATTLTPYCYNAMFQSCYALYRISVLPALEMKEGCYKSMYANSRPNLYSVPKNALPAKTLAKECYRYMFEKCMSLTTAPDLPAEVLAEGCYQHMFSECNQLKSAPEIKATTLAKSCCLSMFLKCTELQSGPDLLAETLVQSCYQYMFSGCTKLSAVKCMATDISATNCLGSWLNNVAASGTFTKKTGVTWPTGTSGIPSGWTVVEQ